MKSVSISGQKSSNFDLSRTWTCSTLNERALQAYYVSDKFTSIGITKGQRSSNFHLIGTW